MSIDIDPAERDSIFDFLDEQWEALREGWAAGEYTPGDGVVAGVNLIIVVGVALIPGELDNLAVSFFRAQIDAGLKLLGAAIDKGAGIHPDAAQLRTKARKKREDAADHIAEATRKEIEGTKLFGKSPERHHKRATTLMAEVAALEAEADALDAGV